MAKRRAIPYVRLSEKDNIVVLTRHVEKGETLDGLDGKTWTMQANLEPGNKLAACTIAPSERVLKYGFPIGTATRAIDAGAHVHEHNLRSDYFPTKTEENDNGDGNTN